MSYATSLADDLLLEERFPRDEYDLFLSVLKIDLQSKGDV